ncbi:MAG: hypothetical protein ACR2GA_07205 [Chloroflexota bacterium]
MIPHLEFDTDRTESAISPFSLATDLADILVRNGMPFRQAHRTVAELVSTCIEQGRDLGNLDSVDITDLPELTAAASVLRKRTAGSTNPKEVRRQVEAGLGEVARRWQWLEERT